MTYSLLKTFSLSNDKEKAEKVEELDQSVRGLRRSNTRAVGDMMKTISKQSICDNATCWAGTACRNGSMFVLIALFFGLIPFVLLILAVGVFFTQDPDEEAPLQDD